MSTERDNLETHVDLCELRYKQLHDRMNRVEQRIDVITIDIKQFKEEMAAGFDDIKTLLTTAKDEKFKTLITATGTVIVGLLTLLGYIVSHLK